MEPPRPLTRKQAQALRAIQRFVESEGYPPSMRELAQVLGITPGTAHFHVHSLQDRGYLAHDGTDHGITLGPDRTGETGPGTVPFFGTLTPGRPLSRETPPARLVEVPAHMARPRTHVLLVRGDRLASSGILDGDQVVVQAGDEVVEGRLAVLVGQDGAATIAPLPERRKRASSIHGRVIGLVRDLS